MILPRFQGTGGLTGVSSLAMDDQGRVLAGTNSGEVVTVDVEAGTHQPVTGGLGPVWSLVVDGQGRVLAGTPVGEVAVIIVGANGELS